MHSFEDLHYSHCFFRISSPLMQERTTLTSGIMPLKYIIHLLSFAQLRAKSQNRIGIKTGRKILDVLFCLYYIMVISQTSHFIFHNIFLLHHNPTRIPSQERENGMPTKRWEIINNIRKGNGKMANAQVRGRMETLSTLSV